MTIKEMKQRRRQQLHDLMISNFDEFIFIACRAKGLANPSELQIGTLGTQLIEEIIAHEFPGTKDDDDE